MSMHDNQTEVLTGILISQVALVQTLERTGVLRVQDYVDELRRCIDNVPSEQQHYTRFEPLRMLIKQLTDGGQHPLQ